MELFVLRHAIAADRGEHAEDAARPLTRGGEAKLRKIVQSFGALEVAVEVIVTSPLVRARQTADIVGEHLRTPVIADDRLCAGATPSDFVAALHAHASQRDVMVIGHEPDLSGLIATLVTGEATAEFRLKKAGLARITVQSLRAGRCGQLQWLLWPKQMLQLS